MFDLLSVDDNLIAETSRFEREISRFSSYILTIKEHRSECLCVSCSMSMRIGDKFDFRLLCDNPLRSDKWRILYYLVSLESAFYLSEPCCLIYQAFPDDI